MIQSFDPIINNKCKVLVLGTMPGVRSLEKQEYYGHERNHFWKLIYGIFGMKPSNDYQEKKQFLLDHRIALWDVLRTCSREGSLDAKIRNPIPNDFSSLLRKYSNIKHMFFNGAKAEEYFRKLVVPQLNTEYPSYTRLPSSSPARTLKFELKLQAWRQIKEVTS